MNRCRRLAPEILGVLAEARQWEQRREVVAEVLGAARERFPDEHHDFQHIVNDGLTGSASFEAPEHCGTRPHALELLPQV